MSRLGVLQPFPFRRSIRVFSLALLMAIWSLPSQAGTVTHYFTGTIDVQIGSGSNTIPVGTPFSGTLSYALPKPAP